jgi:hypothetical protein
LVESGRVQQRQECLAARTGLARFHWGGVGNDSLRTQILNELPQLHMMRMAEGLQFALSLHRMLKGPLSIVLKRQNDGQVPPELGSTKCSSRGYREGKRLFDQPGCLR